MKISLLLCPLIVLFLSGCQTWTRGGQEHASKQGYRLDVPADWIFHPAAEGRLLATKDGVFLQELAVHRQPLSTPLPLTKRSVNAAMSTAELAEALIDETRADRDLLEIEVLDNSPTTLGGAPAARVLFSYTVADEIPIRGARYVVVHEPHVYFVRFSAPSRHYFERDLPAVENILRSFAFTAK